MVQLRVEDRDDKHYPPVPCLLIRSHSVGGRERSPEGILDLFHVTAKGVIAGANMVLADFHHE
jgi:3-deoxy-7-phosphoheptulonate synthase